MSLRVNYFVWKYQRFQFGSPILLKLPVSIGYRPVWRIVYIIRQKTHTAPGSDKK